MKQVDFKRTFEGWHLYQDFYGDAAFVETTLTYEKENFYLGVGVNITFEGSYQLRITDKSFAETGTYTLYFCKRTNTLKKLCSVSLDPKEILMEKGKPFTLRLEYSQDTFTGWFNGKQLLTYHHDNALRTHEAGWCGVWIHPERAATIQEFCCGGKEKPLPAKKALCINGQEAEYFMECNALSVDSRIPHWSVEPHEEAWCIGCSEGSNVFCSPRNNKYNQTHLHVFEKNPCIKMKFKAEAGMDAGRFGLLIRHSPETAYVKIGYDVLSKCWFIEDVPALYDCKSQRFESERFDLLSNTIYELEVAAYEDAVTLSVGEAEMIKAVNVRQTGFGRIGLFAENMALCVHEFYAKTPNANSVMDGVVKTYVDSSYFAASTEIEEAKDGRLVGITKVLFPEPDKPYQTGIYTSSDMGVTFAQVPEGEAYSGLDTKGAYQSALRLKNGKYIQVLLAEHTQVQESDDLIHWKNIGKVIPDKGFEIGNPIFHVNSLAEYEDENGKRRIFLPIAFSKKTVDPDTKNICKAHDTIVFYSDDDGYTWTPSEVSTYEVLQKEGHPELLSFAESKIVKCADGRLRLYNSRNDARFICYIESFDFGKTWQGFNTVRELQCAKSSFGVVEDPYESGTYYMAWVNDTPTHRGSLNGRTRLSLARSYDGKKWHFLCDAEYTSLRYADEMPHLYIPLFQILDPSVTVTKDYVFVTYGMSASQAENSKPGSLHMVHNAQRPALVRFEKTELKDLPWNETRLSDMSFLTDYDSEEVLV